MADWTRCYAYENDKLISATRGSDSASPSHDDAGSLAAVSGNPPGALAGLEALGVEGVNPWLGTVARHGAHHGRGPHIQAIVRTGKKVSRTIAQRDKLVCLRRQQPSGLHRPGGVALSGLVHGWDGGCQRLG